MGQVDHPSHYNNGKIEVIDFIEDKKLNFHRGNAIKYISRAGLKNKDTEIEDLEKAIWYLQREIKCIKENKNDRERND
jgi:hypothetical protein